MSVIFASPTFVPTFVPTTPDQAPKFLGARGAAAMYGVSWRTWLRWADAGLVPKGVKLGGRRLWKIAELEAHIQSLN